MNVRELASVTVTYENGVRKVSYKIHENSYASSFLIYNSPTANCQLSCGSAIGPIGSLSRDHLRHLLVEVRKSNASRRILLMDVRQGHALSIVKNLAPGSIISNTAYTSTNGSKMNILLVRLSSVRQLSGARIVPTIATRT